jgi:tRNA modification GTPase
LKKKRKPLSAQDDTIAAIATPTGSGGIGIIRISGPRSKSILARVFRPRRLSSKPKPYLLRFGRFIDPDGSEEYDEVMAAYFPKGKSFTGEHMVELYCHSGHVLLKKLLDKTLQAGCRPAEAGEFSFRRFLNHGTDLTRLEGAAELVAAKTDLAFKLGREQLLGSFGDHIEKIRKEIVHLLAELEADIDFPEEEAVGRIGRDLLERSLNSIISSLENLSASYKTGKIIRDGYRVLLMGAPNSGKSSLFNRLVRQNRALVTPIAGTTRDYLTEWIDIDGLPVELFDTAGLRPARGTIEEAGIKETKKLVERADLIIHLVDLSRRKFEPMPPLEKGMERLVGFNKSDLVPDADHKADSWANRAKLTDDFCVISAKTGKAIPKLSRMVFERAGVSDLSERQVVTSERHKAKIDLGLKHLRKVRKILDQPPEIISFELRQAADRIGEITGKIYTEDILDEIFANFCIGK